MYPNQIGLTYKNQLLFLLSTMLVPFISSCGGPSTRGLKLRRDFVTDALPEGAKPKPGGDICEREKLSWGVVVGINDYQSPQITDLEGAAVDAWAMYHYLTSPYGAKIPSPQVTLLLNQEATRAKVEGAIGNLKACPQDQVYLYFAGHGLPEPGQEESAFLLTYDSEPSNLVGSAISMQKLPEFLTWRVGKASELMMIIDACHSGNIQLDKTRGLKLKPSDPEVLAASTSRIKSLNQSINNFTKDKQGWGVISASASNQLAEEATKGCILNDKEYTGGIFTCNILQGLSGAANANQDEEITLNELYRFVKKEVHDATNGNQSPQLSGSLNPDKGVFSVPKNQVLIPEIPSSLIKSVDSAQTARTTSKIAMISSGVATLTGVIFHGLTYQSAGEADSFRPTQDSLQGYEAIESQFATQKQVSQIAYGVALSTAIVAGIAWWYQSTSRERERQAVYERPPWLRLGPSDTHDLVPKPLTTSPNGSLQSTQAMSSADKATP